jgi:predicted nucleic acid-binding Zn ribbon protein
MKKIIATTSLLLALLCNNQQGVAQNQTESSTTSKATCGSPDLTRLFRAVYATYAILPWQEVAGAKRYDVEYKPASSTTWIVAARGIVANAANASNRTTIRRLTPRTKYNWRVKTYCATGSSYSNSDYFTTTFALSLICDAKITGLKNTNVTKNSAVLNWDYGNTAGVGYIVEYKKSADFEDESLPWERVDAIINNSVTISNLESNIYYVWRVKANCSGSDFDIVQQFITQKNVDCEQAGVNRFFQTSPTTTRVTRTWAEASGAVSYDFEYKLASSSTWIVAATNLPADFALVKKSYTLTGQFQVGVDYNWRVKTYCANSSNYSEVARFSVLSSLSGNNVVSSVKLFPNPVQDALTIELNADDSNRLFNSQNSIVIIDTNGNKVIEQQSKSTTTTLDVQKLKQGVYVLKVLSPEGQILQTQKFVKQ